MLFFKRLYGLLFRKQVLYYAIFGGLLATFGTIGMGVAGTFMAFWVFLLWFSVWQRPYRFELMMIATLGLFGGVVMIPPPLWQNMVWTVCFLVVAIVPIVSLVLPRWMLITK